MKSYTVNIGGLPHTLKLSDEDAKARGLKADEERPATKKATPANKSRTAKNKG